MQARNHPSASTSSAPAAPASKASASSASLSSASRTLIQNRRYSAGTRRGLRGLTLLLLLGPAFGSTGCYYGHLATGQFELLWRRQPIAEATRDPSHPERTRDLLRVVESVRDFARSLGLRVDDQYTSYVDWPGDRVVTSLVRTRPDSIEAVPWWFPIVGELPYKGYFDPARAEAEAQQLRGDDGYDVCVTPVVAYSTLGWLDDPVTTPMLARGPAYLVETLLHELVHATAFLPDSADFNESAALFIGQQAAIRYFEESPAPPLPDWPTAARFRDFVWDRDAIDEVVIAFRDRLLALEHAPDRAPRRAEAERVARAELAELPLRVLDPAQVAEKARLSDACLALRGTYVLDLPRHAKVLATLDGRLDAMIARLALWADEDRPAETFFDVGADEAGDDASNRSRADATQ